MALMVPKEILYDRLFAVFRKDPRYCELKEFVHNLPKAEAIPVNFIVDYLNEHDAVCKANLTNMLIKYNEVSERRNRVPLEDYDL